MSPSLTRYVTLLDELLWQRAVNGVLGDATEERFAEALNDCRRAMPPEDEAKISAIVAGKKAIAASASLDLIDTEPPETDDAPLRRVA